MSELVLLHHNEAMTTSLAIAEGTENTHESVIKLVRKYVEDLQNFGRVGFEIEPFATNGGVQSREVAFLNEPQATLLITFLRNSEIVVRFKVALVKAFYEMRDRLRGDPQPQFLTGNLSHGADLAVAADRTFRSFLRAGRSAGMALPQALRIANRQTVERTGMDMLAELDVDPDSAFMPKASAGEPEADALAVALRDWLDGAGQGPWSMAEILRAAGSIPPDSRNYAAATVAAGRHLRALGLVVKKTRFGGKPPRNLWFIR